MFLVSGPLCLPILKLLLDENQMLAHFLFFVLSATKHYLHCPQQVPSPFWQLGLILLAVLTWLHCICRSEMRANIRLGRLYWAQQPYNSINIYIPKHHSAVPNKWQWFILRIHASVKRGRGGGLLLPLPLIYRSHHFSTHSNLAISTTLLMSPTSSMLVAALSFFVLMISDIAAHWPICETLSSSFLGHHAFDFPPSSPS